MSTATLDATPAASATSRKGLRLALGAVQALLAAAFGMAGVMKLFTPIAQLGASLPWVTQTPELLVRFIGASELAGALGLVLPALTRVKPGLTALAAAGLVVVMVLAAGFHVMQGEPRMMVPSVVLGSLAAFVAWGRAKAAPIAARG